MRRTFLFVLLFYMCSQLFGISIKEKICKAPFTALPYNNSKVASFLQPVWGFYKEQTIGLPMYTYHDLGLTQKNDDPNTECCIWRKFQINTGKLDLLALSINISELDKKILVTYQDEKLIDWLEVEVGWSDWISMKQWRIDSCGVITVTYLQLLDSAVVMCLSGFESIKAQRLDLFYIVEADGKFHQVNEVRYKPQNYTRAYLTDKTKDIWNGKEEVE